MISGPVAASRLARMTVSSNLLPRPLNLPACSDMNLKSSIEASILSFTLILPELIFWTFVESHEFAPVRSAVYM